MLDMVIPENRFTSRMKLSSSAFAILGGVMLASNTNVSSYGFVFLAISSCTMLLANFLLGNRSMIVYAGSLFLFVDCLGIYRWVLK
jgi:hypothetical protein